MTFFKLKVLAAAVLFAPALASAAITINVGSTSLPVSASPQSFVLDVTFTNDGASQPLVGHDTALQITSLGTGLSITGVGTGGNKVANPVLSGDPSFSTNSGLYLFSEVQQAAGSIDNGDGLFRILLQAAPGTTGTFQIDFFQSDSSPFDTKLYADANLNEVPGVTFIGGTVTFVPEPAAMSLLVLGLPLLARRRR